MDNWLQSFSPGMAKYVIDKLRVLLMEGCNSGQTARQIIHLSKEIRLENSEQWLNHTGFLMPFTTRAKVLIQQLWDQLGEWDDPPAAW